MNNQNNLLKLLYDMKEMTLLDCIRFDQQQLRWLYDLRQEFSEPEDARLLHSCITQVKEGIKQSKMMLSKMRMQL